MFFLGYFDYFTTQIVTTVYLKLVLRGRGSIYCALPEMKGKHLFLQQNCILNNKQILCFSPVEVLISNYNIQFLQNLCFTKI